MNRWVIGIAGALLAATAAQAGMPVPQEMRCAVGGERFTHITTASYSTFGARPDGKPYGSWRFPLDLPVCPGNGLVMFRDFDRRETERLKTLIASPEYRTMIGRDTPYYRAAWLARQLDPATEDAIWLLMQAGWEADDKPELRARYLREFIDAADALPRADESAWISAKARAVNARRELGDFEGASAALAALPVAEWSATPLPEAEPTGAELAIYEAAERKKSIAAYLQSLAPIIARKDPSPEPLDMIGPREAALKCRDLGERASTAPGGDVCKSAEVLRWDGILARD